MIVPTVFNKIHRLKQQPDWTWDHFLTQIDKQFAHGLDEKTLYSHYRQPHKKPNSQVSKIINQLHDQCFPDPFPESANRLMRLYNNLVKCSKHLTITRDIEDLECFLVDLLQRDKGQDVLYQARLNWLLGNIQFDRLPALRDNGRKQQLGETKAQAIEYYQRSVSAIEAHNAAGELREVGAHHLFKARHNILACYLNAVPEAGRSADPDILSYLKESNYISSCKQILSAEPFQWNIARNGLRFSALVQNGADVKYFFGALLAVSDKFLDLNYTPLNQGPIAEGQDFQWAIEHVLTPQYLSSLKNR